MSVDSHLEGVTAVLVLVDGVPLQVLAVCKRKLHPILCEVRSLKVLNQLTVHIITFPECIADTRVRPTAPVIKDRQSNIFVTLPSQNALHTPEYDQSQQLSKI